MFFYNLALLGANGAFSTTNMKLLLGAIISALGIPILLFQDSIFEIRKLDNVLGYAMALGQGLIIGYSAILTIRGLVSGGTTITTDILNLQKIIEKLKLIHLAMMIFWFIISGPTMIRSLII